MRPSLLLASWAAVAQAAAVSSPVQTRADGDDDVLALITKRRIADLSQFPNPPAFAKISTWLESQKEDGTWSDVNYLSGCEAQRANWPIQEHWNRLITFGAAWSGANPSVPASWKKDDKLLAAITKGFDYWFKNDYTPADCMGDGGNAAKGCPCGTPGLWNTNWYGQAILIPQLCSTACLLVKDAKLTDEQRAGCERIPLRSYALRDGIYGTGGRMTGANAVLVMQNSVSLGLFTGNESIVADAFSRSMSVMTFIDEAGVDGIHRDGTFLQHKGLLYNGNYGKDLFNAFIQLQGEAVGTPYGAKDATRDAMSTYVKGNEWMIFTDYETKREHWDFNAIGRFVAFPAVDLQANSDINFNTTKLAAAVADFEGPYDVKDSIRRLLSNGTEKLTGNKNFWASDFMVHRRKSFTLTNKMISTRSSNSEAVNGANPYAYHLGQGTLFSYVEGNEYKDIMGAWDWNLIPGTTVLLNKPKLQASAVQFAGKKDFVGVVSDGKVGTAVVDYLDPMDGSVSYRKSWFYVEDGVIVTTTDIKTSGSAGDAPVITVLDNRAAVTDKAWANGRGARAAESDLGADTLYYGGNGYLSYGSPFSLTLSLGKRTGNWSEISTSKQGLTTSNIFSAYTTHTQSNFTYAFFPATTRQKLASELDKPTWTPIIEQGITGIVGPNRLSLAFWPGGNKSIKLELAKLGWAKSGSVTITSDKPGVYLFKTGCSTAATGKGKKLVITLSDPTQKLSSTSFSFKFEGVNAKTGVRAAERNAEGFAADGDEVSFGVKLPGGGLAGSSVSREMNLDLTS